MDPLTWKRALAGKIAPDLAAEIDAFETDLRLRQQGKIEEKLFAEGRLRRGVYGQRYDNGKRHDGVRSRDLAYPEKPTKGPQTVWDAPGMMRIKIPYGAVSPDQLDRLADLAEEYSDGILHVTTRQDFQLHYVHIDDTPDLMRRLGEVGITTREACGNTVRNITACPYAGVCAKEPFDVSPYAEALFRFLLGHPDTQDFGRKFKIAFSGCHDEACALVKIHDIGAVAEVRGDPGALRRGFVFYVGGGLGSVPHEAKVLDPFVPEEELLPVTQAVCRVFARLGEKKNRARARLKFVVAKLGIEEFRRLVHEERKGLGAQAPQATGAPNGERGLGAQAPQATGAPNGERGLVPDPRWTDLLRGWEHDRGPKKDPSLVRLTRRPEGFDAWKKTNVRPQRQPGFAAATVLLPLGDLTSAHARRLGELARKYAPSDGRAEDAVRTTVDQNIVFRWVRDEDLPSLYEDLKAVGLAQKGAGTIADLTACPGTDTCKLGVSSSRGLGAALSEHLAEQPRSDARTDDLRIKVSGCFNACGQHHIADLGFWGVQRKVGGHTVPHFQVVLGGRTQENAASFGLAIGAIPSKNVPKVVDRLTETFAKEGRENETFQGFIERIGKAKLRALLEDLFAVPPKEIDASFYSDWRDPRTYSIGDLGMGECAGEVVPFVQFGLAAAERQVFEAQLALDAGQAKRAAEKAYTAMIQAAEAVTRHVHPNTGTQPDDIVRDFQAKLCEPKLFWDPFAGDKFAHYLLRIHGRGFDGIDAERAHRRVEEATLFIEAAHACYQRIDAGRAQGGAL